MSSLWKNQRLSCFPSLDIENEFFYEIQLRTIIHQLISHFLHFISKLTHYFFTFELIKG